MVSGRRETPVAEKLAEPRLTLSLEHTDIVGRFLKNGFLVGVTHGSHPGY